VNEFLESLKEEVLPGIWSKGVALSRNLKSVEKISPSSEKKELKFKIQTTERILAFQVTLWPADQDSYCNCGSKIEPCHHIVAVALAVVAGNVSEPSAEDSVEGSKLAYTWVIEREKISLKREILVHGVPQKLEGSLVGLIGGIQSGRIKLPLPPTTTQDLKLDELFSSLAPPSWAQVLKVMADLPPIKTVGISGFPYLKANPNPIRETVIIADAEDHGLHLSKIPSPTVDQKFNNGMVRIGDTIYTEDLGPAFQERTISRSQFAAFLTDILPRLRDHYELDVRAAKLPEFTESDPEIRFKTEQLGEVLFVTPEIYYPTENPNEIAPKDAEKERELFRELRIDYGLAPKMVTQMDPKAALQFREKLEQRKLSNASVDSFLGSFLSEAKVSLSDALSQKDLLMKLLLLREKRPKIKANFSKFLNLLSLEARKPEALTTGYFHAPLLSTLREYQREGVKFLNEKRASFGGAILADDMGLGKTLQTLALMNGKTLVVCPTSLITNWANEAKRFRPDLKINIYHGPNREFDGESDLTITSYAILRLEPEKFLDTHWEIVALDEAHVIRNPETQAAIASFQLNANFKLALTGTPIQNRRKDLLSLFQFVTPALFESEDELDERIVKNLILRRTKSEVLPELPPKTYLEHAIELTKSERDFYQTIFAAAKSSVVERLDAGENLSPLTFFETLLRSRQALDHRGLVDAEQLKEFSSKVTRILEVVEEVIENGHSLLLYSQWTKFLDILEPALKNKIRYLRLDGETQNRGEIVEQFQKDETPTVFLLSLHAGGVGLNLTRASHVMFCEPWWNPYKPKTGLTA
jgi:SNF2 family DNA or RNA helicase